MVEIQFTPVLVPYALSAVVTLGLTVYAASRYRTGEGRTVTGLAFLGIVLSVSVWTVARGMELLFAGSAPSQFWLSVLHVGYGGATMSALFFGLAFTGRTEWLTRRNVALLLAVPVMAVGVVATNHVHNLLWTTEQTQWGSLVVHHRNFEPLAYAYLLYTAAAALVGFYYLLRAAYSSSTVYRRQTFALTAGSTAALTTGGLYTLGWQPLVPEFFDLAPVGFAVMGLCFGYALFEYRLLDLMPVVRDTVVEGMRDGYIVLDTEDRVLDMNTAAREMFDIDESAPGADISEVVPACADFVAAHEHDTRTETDISLAGEDGDQRFLTVRVSSLREGDRLVGRLLLFQDITDRQRVRRRYQALIENSSDLILVVDRNREITYASPSAESIAGVDPESLTGQSLEQFVHPDDRTELDALVERLLDDPGEKTRYEFRIQNADDEWLFLEASVWNLLDNPFVDGIVVNAREITERKRRERELRRANDRLEEFASVISHDLRNPLNVAHGHLELARDTGDDEHFEKVTDSLDRIDDIIEDVLTLAREGKSIGETEPVDLSENARTAWTHVETNGAVLALDNSPTLSADSDRLLQLFENLFRNAIEHATPEEPVFARDSGTVTPEHDTADGQLTVTVGYHDGRLYVEDDGQGIPPDSRDDVLEAGYTTSRDGTGFGLSIVAQVAEAHGWDVEVTESAEGGARFEFHSVETVESDA